MKIFLISGLSEFRLKLELTLLSVNLQKIFFKYNNKKAKKYHFI